MDADEQDDADTGISIRLKRVDRSTPMELTDDDNTFACDFEVHALGLHGELTVIVEGATDETAIVAEAHTTLREAVAAWVALFDERDRRGPKN